jgi:hypothetical protein
MNVRNQKKLRWLYSVVKKKRRREEEEEAGREGEGRIRHRVW